MAVTTPALVVDGIEALLGTIDGVGKVYRQRKIMRNEAQVKDVLKDDSQGRLQGWFITPALNQTMVSDRRPGFYGIGQKGGGQVFTWFRFQIEGWMAVDDAAGSEETFRDLVWRVADEFNSYGMLNIPGINEQDAANVAQFTYAILAGTYLMHYAQITVGFMGRTRPATN